MNQIVNSFQVPLSHLLNIRKDIVYAKLSSQYSYNSSSFVKHRSRYLAVKIVHLESVIILHVPGPAAKVRLVRPWPYRFLREKKWRRLDSNLRVRYRVASPSSSP